MMEKWEMVFESDALYDFTALDVTAWTLPTSNDLDVGISGTYGKPISKSLS